MPAQGVVRKIKHGKFMKQCLRVGKGRERGAGAIAGTGCHSAATKLDAYVDAPCLVLGNICVIKGGGVREGGSVKLCNIRPGRTQIVVDRVAHFWTCFILLAYKVGGAASCLSYLSVTKTLSKHTNNILNIKQKYTQIHRDDYEDDDDDDDGESQAEMGGGRMWEQANKR